jgi:hypothetical protein
VFEVKHVAKSLKQIHNMRDNDPADPCRDGGADPQQLAA